jgi:hypothetical protein
MKRAFDQDDIRLMANALDGAWNYLRCRDNLLSHPDKAEETRLMLARRIFAAEIRDERYKYRELLSSALKDLAHKADFESPSSIAY